MTPRPPCRSLLLASGVCPDDGLDPLAADCDMVTYDLAGCAAPTDHASVIAAAAAATRTRGQHERPCVGVRVSPLARGQYDTEVATVSGPGLAAVILPGVTQAYELTDADVRLARHEHDAGLPPDSVGLWPEIGSCVALTNLEAMLAQPPVRTGPLVFDALGCLRDAGIAPTADEADLAESRWLVATVAQATGLPQPIDAPYPDLDDDAGLAASCQRALKAGFGGKCCLATGQLDTVNAAFTLDAAEVEHAREVLAAVAAARATGSIEISVRGRLVGAQTLAKAQRLLAMHDRHTAGGVPAGTRR